MFNYTSNKTNSTYHFNTNLKSYADADLWCQDAGGRLVAYGSLAEQVRVWAAVLDMQRKFSHCQAGPRSASAPHTQMHDQNCG